MQFTLEVQNYRGLRNVRWSPRGVCALVGPNGGGKTTLLSVLELLRQSYEQGFARAVDLQGGSWGLRHLDALPDEPCVLALESGAGRWELHPSTNGPRVVLPVEEHFFMNKTEILRQEPNAQQLRIADRDLQANEQLGFFRLMGSTDVDFSVWQDKFSSFTQLLKGYQLYRNYHLSRLKQGSRNDSSMTLHFTGSNVFSLLRNWRDSRVTQERWEFIIESLREIAQDFFSDIEFDVTSQTVSIRVIDRKMNESIPVHLCSNGFLVVLIHLCAVASAEPGGVVAIDEPENSLHPFAIRKLVECIRMRAEEKDLTILLATHSPALLHEFKDEPGKVYILEPGAEEMPVPLDKHRNPEWLAHFSLGNLYMNEEFGAPKRSAARSTLPSR